MQKHLFDFKTFPLDFVHGTITSIPVNSICLFKLSCFPFNFRKVVFIFGAKLFYDCKCRCAFIILWNWLGQFKTLFFLIFWSEKRKDMKRKSLTETFIPDSDIEYYRFHVTSKSIHLFGALVESAWINIAHYVLCCLFVFFLLLRLPIITFL